MSAEDDRWALDNLVEDGQHYSSFGVGSFRFEDQHRIVHRIVWQRVSSGWEPMCRVVCVRLACREAQRKQGLLTVPDPGPVTCLQCLGEGA